MKRQWLPTSKGTELFPKVIQAPTKLVIRGVETGTPLYRAVAAKFAGRLKSFHAKQQQSYALSEQQIQRGHIEWTDGRATYTNTNGQEILELEVDLRPFANPQPPEGDWWTWALIDVHVPDVFHAPGVEGAFIRAYRRVPAPQEATQKFGGYVFSQGVFSGGIRYWSDGMDPFVLSFAPFDDPIVSTVLATGDEQMASLLVDLRNLPKTQVVIDIWASISGYTETLEPVQYSQTTHPGNNVAASSTDVTDTGVSFAQYTSNPVLYEAVLEAIWTANGGSQHGDRYYFTNHFPASPGNSNGFYELYAPAVAYVDPAHTLFSLSDVIAPAPAADGPFDMNLGPADGGPAWTTQINPVYHSPSGLLQSYDDMQINGHSSFPGQWCLIIQHKRNPIITTTLPVDGPVGETRPATVMGTGAVGFFEWVQSFYDTPTNFDYARWEMEQLFPDHVALMTLGVCTLSDEDRLVGTVIIDPVKKSITFTPTT